MPAIKETFLNLSFSLCKNLIVSNIESIQKIYPRFWCNFDIQKQGKGNSIGGWTCFGPYIKIHLKQGPRLKDFETVSKGEYLFYGEYPHYDKDPCIGNFLTKNPWDILQAIVLHELSHALEKFLIHFEGKLPPSTQGHDVQFQKIYTALRKDLLNTQLPFPGRIGKN